MNRTRLSLTLGLVACAATGAWGFTESTTAQKLDKPLRQFDLVSYRSELTTQAQSTVESALTAKFDGEWHVYNWNPQTMTPSNFYGSGAVVSDVLTTQEMVVGVARGLINQNRDVFRANVNDLRIWAQREALGKQSIIFQQSYHGVDVIGGRVHLIFTDEGRFFTGGSDFYSNIEVNWKPSITAKMAEAIAQRDVPFNPETDRVEVGTRLFILPVPISETTVEHHLVWRATVRTREPLGKWQTYVDAHTGEILSRDNGIYFANYTGNADGDVEEDTYCNGTQNQAYKYLRVNVTGGGTTFAGQNGTWTITNGDNTPRTVTADLYSPYVDLNNNAGAEAQFSGTATPGVPLNVHFNASNSAQDERDTYLAVNDIHDFFNLFDPAFTYSNQRISAFVSINDPTFCPGNAYWDGTINFCPAGGGFANTGTIQGVVHHEFGHGVQNALIGGQGNEGLGEGNGDVLANFMTEESIIGRGFYQDNCNAGIRNSHNALRYPENVVGQEIHAAGRVIAGFHWDLTELLEAAHGQQTGFVESASLWHFGRKLSAPQNQTAQVLATFVADDNNGNLSDGTPNFNSICAAAANHGFSCPAQTQGITITHTPIVTTTTEGSKVINCTITTGSGTLVPAELYVDYRVNGGSFTRLLLAGSGVNNYTATIPALSQPSEVEYYIHAATTTGKVRTSPEGAPVVNHTFDIPLLYDTQEAANSWTINPDGNDNATTGQWVRVDPNGTAAQPENDHTPAPGTTCWVTGNAAAGQGDGVADVDGGKTTLQTVTYDLTGAFTAKVKFFHWYSNDAGQSPGLDPWVVEIRNNGGPWQQILNTTASTVGWEPFTDDLKARYGAALGSVQVRFTARDNDPPSLVEAGVDDFEILADMDGSVAVGDPNQSTGLRFALFGAAPNPVRGTAQIVYQVPAQSRIRITVYDVNGRAIRELLDDSVSAGNHAAAWDGRDDGGHSVASGVYYYRMVAPNFSTTRSLVLTH
ncbi:MAG: FlgD immunoglobulin-like domain containing protein [Candidatus Eisenbacteria bacterium]